ncbi:MAG: hypothetical protein WCP40_06845, partial [Opitutae bacterium]
MKDLVARKVPKKLLNSVEEVSENEFIESGEVWRIRYKGCEPFHINARNGLAYIARLLEKPHETFHCDTLLDLTLDNRFKYDSE